METWTRSLLYDTIALLLPYCDTSHLAPTPSVFSFTVLWVLISYLSLRLVMSYLFLEPSLARLPV